jgi:multiple sugar transport system permease protein
MGGSIINSYQIEAFEKPISRSGGFMTKPSRKGAAEREDNMTAWLMSAPAIVLLSVFLIIPFLMAFGLSFTNQRLIPNVNVPTQFIGLTNYGRMLEDSSFIRALLNNLLFAVVVVPVQTSLSLGMALLVNQKLPGVNFFRTVYFVPVATVMVVVAVIWSLIYNSPQGLMNAFANVVTFGAVKEVAWLDNPVTAFPAIMLLSIWQGAGYQMLIFLAGLQSISIDMYEAAGIDGATPVQQFWKITLPSLRNTLIFVVITTTIFAFQLFDQNWIMTKGGPQNSTLTLVMKMVQDGFQQQKIGFASAISVIFFLIVFLISLVQRRLLPEERAIK